MTKKILIVYASRTDSTAEIAAHVAAVLKKQGWKAAVKNVAEKPDITEYDAVVLGSAIRAGQLLPEAMEWLSEIANDLAEKPFHAFIVCLTLKEDTEQNRRKASETLNPIRAMRQPMSEGVFAGVLDFKKLNIIEKIMMKMIKAPGGDFRNWEEIETWSESMSNSLKQARKDW